MYLTIYLIFVGSYVNDIVSETHNHSKYLSYIFVKLVLTNCDVSFSHNMLSTCHLLWKFWLYVSRIKPTNVGEQTKEGIVWERIYLFV